MEKRERERGGKRWCNENVERERARRDWIKEKKQKSCKGDMLSLEPQQ